MTGVGIVGRGVRAVWAACWGSPVRLPDGLARAFPELEAARFRIGGVPPRLGGWFLGTRRVAAITLWRTVWLSPGTSMSPELLLHELRHVQQFQTVRGFPIRYVWETVRRGYRRNRFEEDARRYARARAHAANASTLQDE